MGQWSDLLAAVSGVFTLPFMYSMYYACTMTLSVLIMKKRCRKNSRKLIFIVWETRFDLLPNRVHIIKN
jgi:hypothetical protein